MHFLSFYMYFIFDSVKKLEHFLWNWKPFFCKHAVRLWWRSCVWWRDRADGRRLGWESSMSISGTWGSCVHGHGCVCFWGIAYLIWAEGRKVTGNGEQTRVIESTSSHSEVRWHEMSRRSVHPPDLRAKDSFLNILINYVITLEYLRTRYNLSWIISLISFSNALSLIHFPQDE